MLGTIPLPLFSLPSPWEMPSALSILYSQSFPGSRTKALIKVSQLFQSCFYFIFSYFFKRKSWGDRKGENNPMETFKCNFRWQITALGWPSSVFRFTRVKLNAFMLPSAEGHRQFHPAGCTAPVSGTDMTRHWGGPASWCSPCDEVPTTIVSCWIQLLPIAFLPTHICHVKRGVLLTSEVNIFYSFGIISHFLLQQHLKLFNHNLEQEYILRYNPVSVHNIFLCIYVS